MLVETEELTDVNDRFKIQEIQIRHELAEDWIDNSWEPEPIDASPGESLVLAYMERTKVEQGRGSISQNSEPRRLMIS
jgi:hypothetical protein